mgnify:CR=1 FL=1
MGKSITFTMIKPPAVNDQNFGSILSMIKEAGFRVTSLKMIQLTNNSASAFYAEHIGKSFFEDLVKFMTSGPIIAAILEKENAVADFRKLIGSTDPAKAEEGTVRALFGKSLQSNAIHGSDSDESAVRESNFFFNHFERF